MIEVSITDADCTLFIVFFVSAMCFIFASFAGDHCKGRPPLGRGATVADHADDRCRAQRSDQSIKRGSFSSSSGNPSLSFSLSFDSKFLVVDGKLHLHLPSHISHIRREVEVEESSWKVFVLEGALFCPSTAGKTTSISLFCRHFF